jgi:hypothetical protein
MSATLSRSIPVFDAGPVLVPGMLGVKLMPPPNCHRQFGAEWALKLDKDYRIL